MDERKTKSALIAWISETLFYQASEAIRGHVLFNANSHLQRVLCDLFMHREHVVRIQGFIYDLAEDLVESFYHRMVETVREEAGQSGGHRTLTGIENVSVEYSIEPNTHATIQVGDSKGSIRVLLRKDEVAVVLKGLEQAHKQLGYKH